MRIVAALLALEIHRGVAGVIRRRLWPRVVFALETLQTCPRLDQSPIDAEMFLADEILGVRLCQDLIEEPPRDLAINESLPVVCEYGRIPHRLVHAQPHEPAI